MSSSLTWGRFKQLLETRGVEDSDEIGVLSVVLPADNERLHISIEHTVNGDAENRTHNTFDVTDGQFNERRAVERGAR